MKSIFETIVQNLLIFQIITSVLKVTVGAGLCFGALKWRRGALTGTAVAWGAVLGFLTAIFFGNEMGRYGSIICIIAGIIILPVLTYTVPGVNRSVLGFLVSSKLFFMLTTVLAKKDAIDGTAAFTLPLIAGTFVGLGLMAWVEMRVSAFIMAYSFIGASELAPEGTGYRAKTRFAKFFNLPELIALFKESADIQTPDMLKLPVPEAEYENVVLKPSEYQQDMVASLAERAEAVRDRKVDATVDNMLRITNDGRKLALDQRLINDMLPDGENSKAAACVGKAFEIWGQTKGQKSTQLIFCDLSTPKGNGTFNVYEDIKNKLVGKGVPPEEIAFIHDANTETKKAELFGKVRSGQVRFLLGSTQKMGAGTNVQDRLIALHHLDVPWRPSDIEQQEGRILRQGNLNPKVKIFRYVTEGTFDSYSWQLIENKQKFIGQIMTSKSPVRSCEDVDEAALTYAEVKALATGNPYIKEKMDLDIQVSKLKLMKANHTSQKYRLEDNIAKHYPQQIAVLKERISGMTADIQTAKAKLPADKEQFIMKVGDKVYTDKKEAGTALVEMCREMKTVNAPIAVGEYAGFKMAVSFDPFNHIFVMNLKGQLSYNLEIGSDPFGNIARINHALESMPKQLAEAQTKLENVERQLETARAEVAKPFAQEAELAEKLERLSVLNALLNMDEKGSDALGMDDAPWEQDEGQKETLPEKSETGENTADAPIPYPVENARHDYAVDDGNPQGLKLTAAMADKPVQRASLKEKLEAFKVKAAEGDEEKNVPKKAKEKIETL